MAKRTNRALTKLMEALIEQESRLRTSRRQLVHRGWLRGAYGDSELVLMWAEDHGLIVTSAHPDHVATVLAEHHSMSATEALSHLRFLIDCAPPGGATPGGPPMPPFDYTLQGFVSSFLVTQIMYNEFLRAMLPEIVRRFGVVEASGALGR